MPTKLKRTHNLKYPNGTYDGQDGQEKTSWATIGGLMTDGEKTKIKLDVVPVNFDGWVQCFPVEENPGHGAPKSNAGQPFDDDIGF
jgi:hypothetical protein